MSAVTVADTGSPVSSDRSPKKSFGLVFVVACVCCASAGGSSAKGARVPLEDETAFGWEEQGEEEGEEEEGEAPARVELD